VTATEDLFTPIHKAIRSMIYDLGARLQSNDFADPATTGPLLADLEHEFSAAMSAGCVLCVVHHHATDEEGQVFPSLARFDPELLRRLIDEHHHFGVRLSAITGMARGIAASSRAEERVAAGIALNREANDFFAAYLAHMNLEDERLIPMMREHFTDEQMRAMRGAIMGGMPPDRLATVLRWMLPSLNVQELSAMLGGLRQGAPPPLRALVSGVAAARLDPERWKLVQARVGG
jgi:hypothetical protein